MTTYTRKELLTDWLAKLPLVDTPVTIGEETHHAFTENGLPLPQALTNAFILPYEQDGSMDEYTEYIPCFRLEHPGQHHVCVYWRVSLMTYIYFIATFTPDGEQIDRAMIAGTYMIDGKLAQRVAHINQDIRIVSSEGRAEPDAVEFDTSQAIQTVLQISPNGKIIYETPSDL